MIDVNCEYCGNVKNIRKKDQAKKVNHGDGKFYCDNDCYFNYIKGELTTYKVNCINCDIEFEVEERSKQFPVNDKYFCNIKCARSYSTKNDDKLETKDATCIECGIDIVINKRASFNTCRCEKCSSDNLKERRKSQKKPKYIPRPPKPIKPRPICTYPECNNEVRTNSNKYCSIQCSALHRNQILFDEIEKTNGIGKYTAATLKRHLIKKRGHQCEICKLTEQMGQPIPLVMDHINGHAKDNHLENLQLVCGNCDMQLPTYKSKNKNSDRKKRVGRY